MTDLTTTGTATFVLAAENVALWVAIGAGVLILLWVVGIYNGLVKRRNTAEEAWSDIDTELKRRYDLVPNLVETVKGYAAHEKSTLEAVVQARNAAAAPHASLAAQAKDENAFTGALRQLFAVAEAYPDLKANQGFLHLQQELSNTEDRIQRSRRFYNANVRDLNVAIESFPGNVIAGLFKFQKREMYEIEDAAQRQAPQVKF
jgi:LemA protein